MIPIRRLAPIALATAILASPLFAGPGLAAPAQSVVLVLKGHQFTPATFTVPAGQRIQITLINRDMATEEFDSHDLKVEKLVTPNARASFFIGPLAPGEYSFMGEFHPATAQGRITAAPAK